MIFTTIMFAYGIINLAKFLLTKEYHDYEGIFSAIASFIIAIASIFYPPQDSKLQLTILFFIWIIMTSLIKLKKADYYNDRKSKLWVLEISLLIIFILSGILTTINFDYETSIQILMIGNFFFIHGILEFIDPIIIFLTKERIKK